MSFAEMRDQVRDICSIVPSVAMVVDGDTGYGNAINAQRTVREHARAGAAGRKRVAIAGMSAHNHPPRTEDKRQPAKRRGI